VPASAPANALASRRLMSNLTVFERLADHMTAALEAEKAEADLPENLAAQLRAGVRMLREAAEPALSEPERVKVLRGAMRQLQTPPMVFLPADVTRAAETTRLGIDRWLRERRGGGDGE
jgi:hypothetical protein